MTLVTDLYFHYATTFEIIKCGSFILKKGLAVPSVMCFDVGLTESLDENQR